MSKKSLVFIEKRSCKNMKRDKIQFKIFICISICVGSINKMYNISRYNCGIGKNAVTEYSQLQKVSDNLKTRKSIF